MDDLLELSPGQFEDLVADYLRNQGFTEVQRVGGAGDLGVDIRCKDEYGRLVVAQCKRYSPGAKIGSPEIQTFFGMVAHHGASRGIFITSSDFTEPAQRLARERDIELVDGATLIQSLPQDWRKYASEGQGHGRPTGPHNAHPAIFQWHPDYKGKTFDEVYQILKHRFIEHKFRHIYDEWQHYEGYGWQNRSDGMAAARRRLKFEILREEQKNLALDAGVTGVSLEGWERRYQHLPAMTRAESRYQQFDPSRKVRANPRRRW